VTAGGGSIAASLAEPSAGAASRSAIVVAMTDSDGEAEVNWTLGTEAGKQTAQAALRTWGADETAEFIATALPGPPAAIQVASGADQLGPTGQPLTMPLTSGVLDGYGNPVPGESVAWVVASGSGTLSETATVTDADGAATVTYTPSSVGTHEVTASVAGVATPATFMATGQAEAADPADDQCDLNTLPWDCSNSLASDQVPPDITVVRAWPSGGMLHIEIEFAGDVVANGTGAPNAIVGYLDIDADQDAGTGVQGVVDGFRTDGGSTGMGVEFVVVMFTRGGGSYAVIDEVGITGTFVPQFSGNRVLMSIPLSILGGDDGLVDLAVVAGTPEPGSEGSDLAPNTGSLAMASPTASATVRTTHRPLAPFELPWRIWKSPERR
jgi:hypothetical protein